MTTKRILTMAAVGALATVSTIAIGATTWLGASAAGSPAAIQLHIPLSGPPVFLFGDEVQPIPPVTKNSCVIDPAHLTGQPFIDLASELVPNTITTSKPGLANYGLGVKENNSSGNGNPCAQIASNEALTLTASDALGRMFTKVRLDLEMTGNAVAQLTLSSDTNTKTFSLQTGTNIALAETLEPGYDAVAPYRVFTGVPDEQGNIIANETVDACAKPSSSGPNNAGSDNCEWNVDPGFEFDTIKMTSVVGATGTSGTVTIEGGADFTSGDHDSLFFVGAAPPVANNDPTAAGDRIPVQKGTATQIDVLANDTPTGTLSVIQASVSDPPNGLATSDGTQILYTPDAGFVGLDQFTYRATDGIQQSNPATVFVRVCGDSIGVLPPGVTASFTRLTGLTACKSNTTTFRSTDTSVLFAPDGDGSVPVDYRGEISFGPKAFEPGASGGTVLRLRYDIDDEGPVLPKDVPWCIDPLFSAGLVTDATVPAGDTWCIATETTTAQQYEGPPPIPTPTNLVTTWQVFGHDDPRFS